MRPATGAAAAARWESAWCEGRAAPHCFIPTPPCCSLSLGWQAEVPCLWAEHRCGQFSASDGLMLWKRCSIMHHQAAVLSVPCCALGGA